MRKNKKGISPLIATVLLIGFAVALAAVVMTWGLDFIKSTAERTEKQTQKTLACATDLQFRISSVECFENNTGGKIAIDNRGQVDIVSLILRIHRGAADVISIDTSKLKDSSNNPLGGVDQFAVITFTHKEIQKALEKGKGAKKVEAVAKVRGGEGEEDIMCPQNIQEFILTPLC